MLKYLEFASFFQFPQFFPSAFAHIPCFLLSLPKTIKFLSKMLSEFIPRH